MLTQENTFTISDLRKNTLEVLEKMGKSEEPITIFSNSKPVAVMMSLQLYNRIQNHKPKIDQKRSMAALEFFIHPPKRFTAKNKHFDPVKAIRELRD